MNHRIYNSKYISIPLLILEYPILGETLALVLYNLNF